MSIMQWAQHCRCLLRAPSKSRKAIVCFVLSVRPYSSWNSSASTKRMFIKFYFSVFSMPPAMNFRNTKREGRKYGEYHSICRSQWPSGLRRGSAAARLLRLWVRIPLGAWMSVCCEWCVLSGRGLCDELITRPEESY